MSDKFKQFFRLLEPDNIFLPKAIVARKDICEEAKIMIGVILTRYRFDTTDVIKQQLMGCTDEDIIREFGNNSSIIKRVREDIAKVVNDFDEIMAQEVG